VPDSEQRPGARLVASAVRRWASSAQVDYQSLIDVEGGNLQRLRDNGVDMAVVSSRRWTRPLTRDFGFVTYNREQVFFASAASALPARSPGSTGSA
jgi:hypothetical protein